MNENSLEIVGGLARDYAEIEMLPKDGKSDRERRHRDTIIRLMATAPNAVLVAYFVSQVGRCVPQNYICDIQTALTNRLINVEGGLS